jgi:hypothetical protein
VPLQLLAIVKEEVVAIVAVTITAAVLVTEIEA